MLKGIPMRDDTYGSSDNRLSSDVTVLIVSYNTCALTLSCLRSIFSDRPTRRVIVIDNASLDGSAQAIALAYPQVTLIRSPENLGFARANNLIAALAETDYLLLLNPDTQVHPGAVDAAVRYAQTHPKAGIVGGRSTFADGRLNPASCWGQITLWSLFCSATGLTRLRPGSRLLNPEGMGDWPRDTAQQVDIVQGSFLLIQRDLWSQLGGFDQAYFMYGEEADLCRRAADLGYHPSMTPDAEYIHHGSAASPKRARKLQMLAQARATLIRDHWPAWKVPFGLGLMWLWAASRRLASRGRDPWGEVWATRKDWLRGYR